MIFKYSKLKEFLEALKMKGPVVSFCEWNKLDIVSLLRHDIDLAIEPAYRLYLVEKEVGVTSTFFFLTNSHSYNIFSQSNKKLIREIANDGFEVGLHFDPLIYNEEADLSEKAKMEASFIEEITGHQVRTISLHNPSIHGRYPVFPNFINTYAEPYFELDNYISDSRMDFRGKSPFEFINQRKDKTIQVLLHPLHFTDSGNCDYFDFFQTYYKDFIKNVDQQFRNVNSKYAKDISPSEFINKLDMLRYENQ